MKDHLHLTKTLLQYFELIAWYLNKRKGFQIVPFTSTEETCIIL